jgi:NitT/TauT family transport system ATP-binding protein
MALALEVTDGHHIWSIESMVWKLDISSLTKVFHKVEDGSTFVALRDIELQVGTGEFLLIVGPSGCGKTTLLRLIAGLERPTTGEVRLDDRKVSGPGRDRGMVFQEHLLFPWLTVKSNVEFGLRGKGLRKDERERLVAENLRLVGLESFANNYPKELSGGMRQRVGLARALAADPEILLMDEPFGSVDAQTRHGLQTELLNIWHRTGKTILFVTHSVEEAVYLADRIVVFHANPGRIAQVIAVDLPHPRERTSPEFNILESQVLKYLSDGATQSQLQARSPLDR